MSGTRDTTVTFREDDSNAPRARVMQPAWHNFTRVWTKDEPETVGESFGLSPTATLSHGRDRHDLFAAVSQQRSPSGVRHEGHALTGETIALAQQNPGRSVKAIVDALGVARSNLLERLHHRVREQHVSHRSDDALLKEIRPIVDARGSYGYRRVTALINRARKRKRRRTVNHKRVYRVMRSASLLLARHTGKPTRTHDGKVITLKSNLRWCSDAFEIRCWNGERVQVAFALDCCDREVMSFVATPLAITGEMVRDLMAEAVEHRFNRALSTPHAVEWLSDNGPPYTAIETREFGRSLGLAVCTTPAYSPESNGMAESFVKSFKRDYVYLNRLETADTVITQLAAWFEDYNEHHPHRGLHMMSPREYLASATA